MTPGTVFLRDALPFQRRPFYVSALAMARALPPEATILHADSNYHHENLNIAAACFVGEWLLCLDTDQAFGASLPQQMWESAERAGADVLTGLVYRRQEPYWPLAYWRDPKGKMQRYRDLPQDDAPFLVGSAGAGVLFVRRRVFEAMKAKWPEEQPFDYRSPLKGEDHAFFSRCYDLGIGCWCDPEIVTRHLMDFQVTPVLDPEHNGGRYKAWPLPTEETT